MKSLEFVEIDIPLCSLTYGTSPCTASIPTTGAIKCFNTKKTCQDRAHYNETEVTLRFAKPTSYLPSDIDIDAASISDISFTPATISLGENLGQRATLSVTFVDHPHSDTGQGYDKYLADRGYDPFKQGSYWGKFRARQPFLQGRSIRWIIGLEGQSLDEMETRHFVIESFDGPTPSGKYTLVAKDILKLLDGDRSQAPSMNTGFLVADITNVATTATLSPSGVGDAEYPESGSVVIGGNEVCNFTRFNWVPNGENDTNTTCLLEFQGANNGTVFNDTAFGASAPKVWTAVGNAVTSTASPKFGNSCFFTTNGSISTPSSPDLNIATGNWTIDVWFKLTAATADMVIAWDGNSSASTSSFALRISSGFPVAQFFGAGGGILLTMTSPTAYNDGNWHFLRVVRNGSNFTMSVDAVSKATATNANPINTNVAALYIGKTITPPPPTTFANYNGSLQSFRITKTALAASGFTLPTGLFAIPTSTTTTGDVLTLTRGQLNTVAAAHRAQDRVQVVLGYTNEDPADIIYDLMVNYGGVDASYIDLPAWQAETDQFLSRVYSANVCEPTSVGTLISELVQQACLSIWWDDVGRKVRLQVLRRILTEVASFTPDNTIEQTLTVKEQPEKRISQVWTYFGQINPTKQLSDTDNYRSMSVIVDGDAEDDYGTVVIKKINSRWIPALGRTVADRLGTIQLGRYSDPPRKLNFDLSRYASTDAALGSGYRVEAKSIQDETGALASIPIQATRINPRPDRLQVEAEEMIFNIAGEDLSNRLIVVDSNSFNINMRAAHDSIYPAPESGITVTLQINSGVTVGSNSEASPALDIGSWPAGVTIVVQVDGSLKGAGGPGGAGGGQFQSPKPGKKGGTALYTRYAIDLRLPVTGKLWGGGGGGGGGQGGEEWTIGGRGGGGAGVVPGNLATDTAGEPGVPAQLPAFAQRGGNGGGPGLPGANGGGNNFGAGGAGGAAGNAIDGNSYVTTTVTGGDQRGPTAG